jgi:hypothetical protein
LANVPLCAKSGPRLETLVHGRTRTNALAFFRLNHGHRRSVVPGLVHQDLLGLTLEETRAKRDRRKHSASCLRNLGINQNFARPSRMHTGATPDF